MSQGKNKKLSKGKKGGKKKTVDPFARKEWYDIKVPTSFTKRVLGKTFVNKSAGIKLAKDALKGRVFESFLADLHQKDHQADSFRKIRLRCEAVQGNACLTQFYGMSITTDKLRSLVKKWQSIIEGNVEVKTNDGFVLRFFIIGFTRRERDAHKKTAYAQAQQIRAIRKKMTDTIKKKFGEGDIRNTIELLHTDEVAEQIQRECRSIYPIKDVFIRKVKVIKAPKMDTGKLTEAYEEKNASVTVEDAGVAVTAEPTVQATSA